MRIFAQMPRWYTRWLNQWVIGNGAIGELEAWLLPYLEDDAMEHIGRGVVVAIAKAEGKP